MGHISFFPGILLVIGASSLARGLAEGKRWYSIQGAVWMIGLAVLFWIDFSFPLILIVIGLSMLFGFVFRPPMFRGSREDDEESIPARSYALEDTEVADLDEEYAAYAEKPKRKRKNEDGLEYYDEDDLR